MCLRDAGNLVCCLYDLSVQCTRQMRSPVACSPHESLIAQWLEHPHHPHVFRWLAGSQYSFAKNYFNELIILQPLETLSVARIHISRSPGMKVKVIPYSYQLNPIKSRVGNAAGKTFMRADNVY